MSKDRVKDKSDKKEKRSDKHGVKKDKKEKKSKVNGDAVAAALEGADVNVVKEKKEKKSKKDAEDVEDEDEVMKLDGDAEVKPIGALVPFANPLADEKATKKVMKSVKKAAKNKTLKRGVKEVIKALRKSPMGGANTSIPGIVVLAADISPMDVISHIPVLCEDHNVPYIYVTSRAELGAAGSTKRPTSVVMVTEKNAKSGASAEDAEEFQTVYAELLKLVQKEMRTVKV